MNSKKLKVKFGKVQQFNSSFSKCNVAIAYHGDNRNMTSISKEVFEKMIPSLYGVPIVGEWKKDENSFGGHGGKIEITDDGVEYIDTTVPIGFIDSQAKVWWEDITEDNGVVNSYLFAETILWTGRYPHVNTILDENSAQSMEIEVHSGSMRDDGYYNIEDATFSALCAIGVEPCFESSGFGQFNLDQDKFKAEFNLMVKELKESIKGGEKVDNEKDTVVEEVEDEKVIETEEETKSIGEEEISTEISLPEEQEELEEEIIVDKNVEEEVESEVDEAKEETEVEETEEVKAEEISEESVIEINEEYERLIEDYKELEEKYSLLEAENTKLNDFRLATLAEQKAELVEEVFDKYATKLNQSDMEDLFDKAIDMTIDELERELSFRLVQKEFNFSKTVKKDSTKLNIIKDTKDNDPYGSASVYFNK